MVLRGFNLDLHVAVIADVKDVFKKIYKDTVEITSWSISGHKQMFGLGPEHVDVVNEHTWWHLDEAMIDAWHVRYDWYMLQFDFFVVTHSPSFATLFERYNKPIIAVNSCRYSLPYCWTRKPNKLNDALRRMVERKQLIIISNNINDAKYIHARAGIVTPVIPSLCDYIGYKHNPTRPEAVLFGGPKFGRRELYPVGNWLVTKPVNYSYEKIMQYKCIVHVPYDCSTMSIFEHYMNGAPLFFPTKRFYKQCVLDGTMEFIHFYGEQFTEKQIDEALESADFYIFPYINYYDNFNECKFLVENFKDPQRQERFAWLEVNKHNILDAWRQIKFTR
jgi:hypothetical protein